MRTTTLIALAIAVCSVLTGCKKESDPVPEDEFVGIYVLVEVITEYNPSDPDKSDEKFLAPETFEITKSDFLDPTTGEIITAYKYFYDDIFLGMLENNSNQLVGTESCPNANDISGASVSPIENTLYQLNMLNCSGREVLANYGKITSE